MTFDEMTAHWLVAQSVVAYDHNGEALYAGSFTFDLGGGYFVLSCHRHDEDDTAEDTGFDCVVSLNDLCRRRRDGYPIYQLFDGYDIARKVLLDARQT
jgi:hypothetical protein